MDIFRLRPVLSVTVQHCKGVRHTKVSKPLLSCLSSSELSRNLHSQNITSNMTYISNDKVKLKADPKTMKLNQDISKPLCIIMSWMMAHPKHVQKYAQLYLDHGFDAISVSCTPWQLLWPRTGSQVIASRLLRFLETNVSGPLVVHGFSVGAYIWAELLVHATNNQKRFQPVLDRIGCQVWDSPADIYEIPVGFPLAVFPNNKLLQTIFRSYIKAHMRIFHKPATQHYMKATEVYHHTPCRAPGLFLVSETDPVGAVERSRHAAKCWKDMGMKCHLKCWPSSPHVSHYIHHPEEYIETLYSHLRESGVLQQET